MAELYDKKKYAERLARIIHEDQKMWKLPVFDNKGFFTGEYYDPRTNPDAGREYEQPDPRRLQVHLDYMEEKYGGRNVMPGQALPEFSFKDPYESEGLGDAAGNVAKRALNDSIFGLGWQAVKDVFGDEDSAYAFFDDRGWQPNQAEMFAAGVGSLLADTPAFGVFGKMASVARLTMFKNARVLPKLLEFEKLAISQGLKGKLLQDAMSQEMARLTKIAIKGRAKMDAVSNLGLRATQSAGAFGGHAFAGTGFRAITDESVDFTDVITETAKSTLMGLVLGGTGYWASKALEDSGRIMKYAGEFATETAALTGTSRLLHGPGIDPYTGEETTVWHDIAYTAATIAALRLGLHGANLKALQGTKLDQLLGKGYSKLVDKIRKKKVENKDLSDDQAMQEVFNEEVNKAVNDINSGRITESEFREGSELRSVLHEEAQKHKEKLSKQKEILDTTVKQRNKAKKAEWKRQQAEQRKITDAEKKELSEELDAAPDPPEPLEVSTSEPKKAKPTEGEIGGGPNDGFYTVKASRPLSEMTLKQLTGVRDRLRVKLKNVAEAETNGEATIGSLEVEKDVRHVESMINQKKSAPRGFKPAPEPGKEPKKQTIKLTETELADEDTRQLQWRKIIRDLKSGSLDVTEVQKAKLKAIPNFNSIKMRQQKTQEIFDELYMAHKAPAPSKGKKPEAKQPEKKTEAKVVYSTKEKAEYIGEFEYEGKKVKAFYDAQADKVFYKNEADGTLEQAPRLFDYNEFRRYRENPTSEPGFIERITEDVKKGIISPAMRMMRKKRNMKDPEALHPSIRIYHWAKALPISDPLAEKVPITEAQERAFFLMNEIIPLIEQEMTRPRGTETSETFYNDKTFTQVFGLKKDSDIARSFNNLSGILSTAQLADVRKGKKTVDLARPLENKVWGDNGRAYQLDNLGPNKDGQTYRFRVTEVGIDETLRDNLDKTVKGIESIYRADIEKYGDYQYDPLTEQYYVLGQAKAGGEIPLSVRRMGPDHVYAEFIVNGENIKGDTRSNLKLSDDLTTIEKIDESLPVPEGTQVMYRLKRNPPPAPAFWTKAYDIIKTELASFTLPKLVQKTRDANAEVLEFEFKPNLRDYNLSEKDRNDIESFEKATFKNFRETLDKMYLSEKERTNYMKRFREQMLALRTVLEANEIDAIELPTLEQGVKPKTIYYLNQGSSRKMDVNRLAEMAHTIAGVNKREGGLHQRTRIGGAPKISKLDEATVQYKLLKFIEQNKAEFRKKDWYAMLADEYKILTDKYLPDHTTYNMMVVNKGRALRMFNGNIYYVERGNWKNLSIPEVVNEALDSFGTGELSSGRVRYPLEYVTAFERAYKKWKPREDSVPKRGIKALLENNSDLLRLYTKEIEASQTASKQTDATKKGLKAQMIPDPNVKKGYSDVYQKANTRLRMRSVKIKGIDPASGETLLEPVVSTVGRTETYKKLFTEAIEGMYEAQRVRHLAILRAAERVQKQYETAEGISKTRPKEVSVDFNGTSPEAQALRSLFQVQSDGDPAPAKMIVKSEPYELPKGDKKYIAPQEAFYGKGRMGYVVGEHKDGRVLYDLYIPKEFFSGRFSKTQYHPMTGIAEMMMLDLIDASAGKSLSAPASFEFHPLSEYFIRKGYVTKRADGKYDIAKPEPKDELLNNLHDKRIMEGYVKTMEASLRRIPGLGEGTIKAWQAEFLRKYVPKTDVRMRSRVNNAINKGEDIADVLHYDLLKPFEKFLELKVREDQGLAILMERNKERISEIQEMFDVYERNADIDKTELPPGVSVTHQFNAELDMGTYFTEADRLRARYFRKTEEGKGKTESPEEELGRIEDLEFDSYIQGENKKDDPRGFKSPAESIVTTNQIFNEADPSVLIKGTYSLLDKAVDWYDRRTGRTTTISPHIIGLKLMKSFGIVPTGSFVDSVNQKAGGEALPYNTKGGRQKSTALTARAYHSFEHIAHETFHHLYWYKFKDGNVPETLYNEMKRKSVFLTPTVEDGAFEKNPKLATYLKETLEQRKPLLDKMSETEREAEIEKIQKHILSQDAFEIEEAFAIFGHWFMNHPEDAKREFPKTYKAVESFLETEVGRDGQTGMDTIRRFQIEKNAWNKLNPGQRMDAVMADSAPRPYLISEQFKALGEFMYRKFVDRYEPLRQMWNMLSFQNQDDSRTATLFKRYERELNFYKLNRAIQESETAQVEAIYNSIPYIVERDLNKRYFDGKTQTITYINEKGETVTAQRNYGKLLNYRQILTLLDKNGNGDKNLDMFVKYALAQTTIKWADAADKAAKDGKGNTARFTNIDTETAASYIREAEASKEFHLVKEAHEHFNKLMHLLVDQMLISGFVTETEAKNIKEFNPYYMTLHRESIPRLEDKWSTSLVNKTGLGVVKNPITGRREVPGLLRNPLLSTFEHMHGMLRAANKHMVVSKMVEAMKFFQPKLMNEKGSAEFIEEIRGDALKAETEVSLTIEAFKKAASDHGLEIHDPLGFWENIDLQIMTWGYAKQPDPTLGERFILPLRDGAGKISYYKLRGDLYDALIQTQSPLATHWMMRMASIPTKIIRNLAVVWNPAFWLRNVPRDMATSAIQTRSNITFKDMLEGYKLAGQYIFGSIDKDYNRHVKDFFNNAIVQSNLQSYSDVGLTKKGLDRYQMIDHKNKAIKMLSQIRAFAERTSAISEAGPRLAEYIKSRESGADVIDSIINSRDVSIDFLRTGPYTQALNMIIPFFNPAVQGFDRLYRMAVIDGIKGGHWRPLAKASMMTVPTVMLWAMHHNEDWYKDLTVDDKIKWWHFKMPGTEQILRLPKPFDWGVLFGGFPEYLLNVALGPEDQDFDAMQGFESMSSRLFPIELSFAGMAGNIAIARPLLEFTTNHDFYFDSDIVDFFTKQKPSELQFYKNTPNIYRAIGQLGLGDITSPLKIKKFLSTISAGRSDDVAYLLDKWVINNFVDAPSGKKQIYNKTDRKDVTVPFVPFIRGQKDAESLNRTKDVKYKKARAKIKAKLDYGLITPQEYNRQIDEIKRKYKKR